MCISSSLANLKKKVWQKSSPAQIYYTKQLLPQRINFKLLLPLQLDQQSRPEASFLWTWTYNLNVFIEIVFVCLCFMEYLSVGIIKAIMMMACLLDDGRCASCWHPQSNCEATAIQKALRSRNPFST